MLGFSVALACTILRLVNETVISVSSQKLYILLKKNHKLGHKQMNHVPFAPTLLS